MYMRDICVRAGVGLSIKSEWCGGIRNDGVVMCRHNVYISVRRRRVGG